MTQLTAGMLLPAHAAGCSKQELFWALSCVRSRTFSGPFVGSSLKDRVRLAGLVSGEGGGKGRGRILCQRWSLSWGVGRSSQHQCSQSSASLNAARHLLIHFS